MLTYYANMSRTLGMWLVFGTCVLVTGMLIFSLLY